jgi:PadR family transcriptional regulator, regulatory protein PadR
MIKELYLGFVRIHILHHADKEPTYGLWLMEELRRHGYRLSPGTLYPILHKMEKEKYLKSNAELVDGKIRKYYKITSLGEKTLIEAKKKVGELIKEIKSNSQKKQQKKFRV